ncbi:MAG: nucleoside phosphorylase [Candidatus Asgardarchaeia archaeon]
MSEEFLSADVVKTKSGKQYHINVGPGDISNYIILVGDPARAHKASRFFDEIEFQTQNREFVTYTGRVGDLRLSVMSTGIGQDNIEIVFIETVQIVETPTFIRVGSCGGLQEYTNCGDLVISTGAVRLENTSLFFVNEGYPAVANFEVVLALIEAAEKLGVTYHVGLTASASGFYGAQGRKVPGIPIRYPNLVDELRERNVINFEMESSALFTFANLKNLRAGMVCAVYANRPKNEFIKPELKKVAEENAIKTGIEAFKILAKMDKIKESKNKKYWFPSLGL